MKTFAATLTLCSLLAITGWAENSSSNKFLETVEMGELSEVKKELTKNPKILETRNSDNHTALSVAAESGLDDIALFLIEKGAKTDGTFGKNDEALSFLSVRGNNVRLLEKLVAKNASVLKEKNKDGDSLLLAAVRVGSPEMVKFLIKKGLSADEKNSSGETANGLAKKLGYSSIQKALGNK